MDARSLVGMTMSARKRAALLGAFLDTVPKHRFQRRRKLRIFKRYKLALTLGDYYAEARAAYRIGQRLRPCPGCCDCNAGPNCPCDDATYRCDGTGVLPARGC